jgi:hypothetical protein
VTPRVRDTRAGLGVTMSAADWQAKRRRRTGWQDILSRGRDLP